MANSSAGSPAPNSGSSSLDIKGSPHRCVFELLFDAPPTQQQVLDTFVQSEAIKAHLRKKNFLDEDGIHLVQMEYIFIGRYSPEERKYIVRAECCSLDYLAELLNL